MNQGMVNTVMSAIVGGIVGAGVVFFAGGKTDLKNAEFENLQVGKLTITKEALLLNKEGTMPEVALRDGSILAENVILGKKVIAQQMQGHAIVANRMLATPDNLITTPMDQWRFFAEIGATTDAGGEFVVRSVNGPASINKPINTGVLFRMGYDPEQRPQMLAIQNASRSPMNVNYEITESQRQMLTNPPQQVAMPGSTAPDSGTPAYSGAAQTTPR
jgi:hypothetical protein